MDHRTVENLFAVVSPGLERVCARELRQLGVADAETLPGGVVFPGKLQTVYQANLWLRSASRILVRFGTFRCRSFPDLYRQAVRLPWGRFVRPGISLTFRVSCRRSRLMHTDRIVETLQAAAGRVLGGAQSASQMETQQIFVRVVDDQVTVSADSSGDLLHRRGYRLTATRAPLRETLAAGILMLLDWRVDEPLSDPMCGTGSFILEGAMLAAGRPPGLERSFAFMAWPGYREGLWRHLCGQAVRQQHSVRVVLEGSDRDAAAIAAAHDNLSRLGLAEQVRFSQRDLADCPVHAGEGLVVCNPPYGQRLVPAGALKVFYEKLGGQLRKAYPGWRIALLCPDPALAQATRLPLVRLADLNNGGLPVGLYLCKSARN